MGPARGYDIFPRTFKARVLLALAFVAAIGMVPGTLFLMGLGHQRLDVAVENESGRELTILVDREVWGSVAVDDTLTLDSSEVFWDDARLVEAIDQQTGEEVFSDRVSRADLEEMDFRIVIEDQ
jgi:hypothetical protein